MPKSSRGKANSPWYHEVSLDDVEIETRTSQQQGCDVQRHTVASICGVTLSCIKHRDLRAICAKLSVKGYKNQTKAYMAELIAAKKLSEEVNSATVVSPSESVATSRKPRSSSSQTDEVSVTSEEQPESESCGTSIPSTQRWTRGQHKRATQQKNFNSTSPREPLHEVLLTTSLAGVEQERLEEDSSVEMKLKLCSREVEREEEVHQHQMAMMRIQEWEKLSDRIRFLLRELQHERDVAIRIEIEGDIAALRARKRRIDI